jgi:SPFH domain / Band 7 family
MLQTLLSWLLSVPGWVWAWLLRWGRENPTSLILVALAIVRSFGTTVQTGWAGVLFSFGRAKKVLEPGFHPLIPLFQKVRQTPIRSITLDLARQRVTTSDGLVFDVHANIIYRVEDPILALTAIDDVRKGILTLMPLLVLALMRQHDGDSILTPQALDAELTTQARDALARWGVGVEQAGLATIAPTAPTMRLTQLGLRVRERAALLGLDAAGDVPAEVVVALVTTGRTPRGRSHAKYHRRKHRKRHPPAPTPAGDSPAPAP